MPTSRNTARCKISHRRVEVHVQPIKRFPFPQIPINHCSTCVCCICSTFKYTKTTDHHGTTKPRVSTRRGQSPDSGHQRRGYFHDVVRSTIVGRLFGTLGVETRVDGVVGHVVVHDDGVLRRQPALRPGTRPPTGNVRLVLIGKPGTS
jgi:hypothetical protein